MNLERTPEQQALADSLRRYLSERAPIRPYVRNMLDHLTGTTPEIWKGLAGMGVTSLLVPEELGGAGMGMVDMGVVLEEMGQVIHPGPFLSSAVAAVSAIASVGDADDLADLLPGLADGSKVGTVALAETGGRAQWRSPRATAEHVTGGWRLSGCKCVVPDGVGADLILVTATCPDGLGLFAVHRDASGLTVTPRPHLDGTSKQADVGLKSVPARRIGIGDCRERLQKFVDRVLAAMAIDGVGTAERALSMAVAYAKERIQFGRAIGSFQAVQHLCADMLQAVELSRAGASYALWACDEADSAESHRACTMAKAFCAQELPRVGAAAIQVHGGIGFTWEHDIHLYYKRLLTLEQAYGTPKEYLEELANQVVSPSAL